MVGRNLNNIAFFDFELLLQKFRQSHFSDEAQSLAVFFLGCWQFDGSRQGPNLGLGHLADGKDSLVQLRLIQLTEEVTLVFVSVNAGFELMDVYALN